MNLKEALLTQAPSLALQRAAADEIARLTKALEDGRERCASLCDAISDEYRQREGMQWPELKTDAQEGAAVCANRIREELK